MNTGLQDAYNLGWKLALAVRGRAAPGLLDTYHSERRPIGKEVVGRTVRAAREGIGAGMTDPARILLREAQLLLGYPDSPIVGGDDITDPQPGMRAPDAAGLRQNPLGFTLRCHELFRHPGHTLLVWAPSPDSVRQALEFVDSVQLRTGGHVRGYVVTSTGELSGRVLTGTDGNLAAAFGFTATASAVCLVRPDGYVSFRSSATDIDELIDHLRKTMRVD
jgi:hypothetical protein